jgi:hypothetical protein
MVRLINILSVPNGATFGERVDYDLSIELEGTRDTVVQAKQ